MQYALRLATLADHAVIRDFNLAMARESEDRTLDAEVLAAGIAAVLRDPAKGFYLVAEAIPASANARARPAGSLMVTYEWSDWRNGRFWWIQSVYVAPAFRRQGVYGLMHRWVRDAALSSGDACGLRLYVEKQNQGAKAAYESLGMATTCYDLLEEEFSR